MTGLFRSECGYPPCGRECVGRFCWEHEPMDLVEWLTEDTEPVQTVPQNRT